MSTARLALAIILTVILQVAIADKLVLLGIRPDLTVLLLLFLGIRRGPLAATLIGFGLGLFQDLLVPPTLGMNMLAKSILGYLIGRVSQQLANPSATLYAPLAALAVILHDLVYLLAYTRLDIPQFARMFLLQSLPTALYTALMALVILGASMALVGSGILRSRGEVGGGHG